jgi:pimeloyl-ACP methyl ester carboxylesterase
MNSYSTFRELACRLEQSGLAVLRFDYRSTGDSFDRTSESKDATGFVEDVRSAVKFVRSLGLNFVAVAGMRLGATLAAAQCNLEPVDALVLWDPCGNGRAFLREQHLLGLVAGRGRDQESGGLAVPGFSGSPEMLEEIAGLNLQDQTGVLAQHVLLLTRSGRPPEATFLEGVEGAKIDQWEASGQRELLDVESPRLTVPSEAVSDITGWIDALAPQEQQPICSPQDQEVQVATELTGEDVAGRAPEHATPVLVKERAVILGSAGLFGILSEPASGGSGPVCIFASVANEHRTGPGRLWVRLSRHLAANGFRCVRFDINGFGESPGRDTDVGPRVFAASNIDDVVDVARAVSPADGRDVVLFGLCSSGYHALEAALTLAPKGVCALNPSLLFRPPELDTTGSLDERRRYCVPQTKILTVARKRASFRRVRLWIPSLDWKIRKPLRTLNWRIRTLFGRHKDLPSACLASLVHSGVDVLVICGPEDILAFRHVRLDSNSAKAAGGHVRLEFLPQLNHTLFSAADRESVTKLIVDHVIDRFGTSSTASPGGGPSGVI